jgi:hypothetical protein
VAEAAPPRRDPDGDGQHTPHTARRHHNGAHTAGSSCPASSRQPSIMNFAGRGATSMGLGR